MVVQYSYGMSLINTKMDFLLFSNVFTDLFFFLSFPLFTFLKEKMQINISKECRSHVLLASAMQALELKTSVHP